MLRIIFVILFCGPGKLQTVEEISRLTVTGDAKNSGANTLNALPAGTLPPLMVGSPSQVIAGTEPYFDLSTPLNQTAISGRDAFISCKVRNLGNKTVSWIRHRDLHILTVGTYTYTTDQRFKATYNSQTNEYTLIIKWCQVRDAGIYECQISTKPERSISVELSVVSPFAKIMGGPRILIIPGQTINLTCCIYYSYEQPLYLFWYHGTEVVSYDSSRGGISIITEKEEDVTTSVLLIQSASIKDVGEYSCIPSSAKAAKVEVAIMNGETPAAMQTGSAGLLNKSFNILTLITISYTYVSIYTDLQLDWLLCSIKMR